MQTKIYAKYKLILIVLLFKLTSSTVFAQGNNYRVMEVVEVEFNSQKQYGNPYMDVDVWIELKKSGSGSEEYRIPVFWDGGNLFRARLVATSPGEWTWNIINSTVKNSDQGFIGRSGSFTAYAADVNANANNHGFIRVDPNTNRTLEYADGNPFFYTADTSWSSLTGVFGFDQANDITQISFQDYILRRKDQGFNGLNVIASFPDDTYTNLWSNKTWGKKTGPNGETPFELNGKVDYKRINPAYWQSVDERMQFLADQGFVTLLETVRRSENWPFRAQDEKDAFYNYVRYLWARYGCYNMIFSWVHHDSQGSIYSNWRELVQHAHDKLSTQLGNRMPYGQPRTAMSFSTSLHNWGSEAPQGIPNALDVQNVSNAERDETMHQWLSNIYDQRLQPALNLEPFYPGWGLHSSNEINPGLNDITMAQMQMYGSVLSGGLAGHAWGDAWYAGAAHATGRRPEDGGTIVPNNDPQKNALTSFESQAMGHLKSFMLDSGHEYHRLIPAAHTNLSNSQDFVHTLSISDGKMFALGFFAADSRPNPPALPTLTNLIASKTYQFEWWNVTDGGWSSALKIKTNKNGILQPPSLPNNDRQKNWAYRIRSLDYIGGGTSDNFALRINTGGSAATHNGSTFSADTYFDTGSTLNRPQTGLNAPYKSFHYSPSAVMGYDIPLNNGRYTVRLHFAELWFGATGGVSGGVGSRVFDVRMENDLVEDNLDVFAEAGADALLTKTHTINVTDGELDIDFSSLASDGGKRHPIINAIEILRIEDKELPIANAGADRTIELPKNSAQLTGSGSDPDGGSIVSYLWTMLSGPSTATMGGASTSILKASNLVEGSYIFRFTVTDDEGDTASDDVLLIVEPKPDIGSTLRINTGGGAVTHNGNTFSADTYFDTGNTLNRPQTGLDAPYKSFRYSSSKVIGYDIPLDNGEYTVRLHFAELWFGATGGGIGGVGSRVFDVRMEGDLVEDNLDVFAEVGADALLTKTYTANVTDGELDIDFSSLASDGGKRHPIINAIEILDARDSDQSDGLIGHWPMDEQSGTKANDVSGRSHSGTLENGLRFDNDKTSGQIGGALIFDGSDDWISLPDIDDGLRSGFSASAWVKPSNVESAYQGVVGSTTVGGFMMFVNKGKLAFKVTTNENGTKLRSGGTIQNNIWQMITCTFDGNAMRWYINGENVHNESFSGTLKDRSVAWIGWSGWGEEYFEGGIDDVRLFNNALTKQQVFSLFKEGNGNTTPVNLTSKVNLSMEGGLDIEVLRVYPNPTSGIITVTRLLSGMQLVLNDFSGRKVASETVTENGNVQMNLSAYPTGIYLLRILNGTEVITRKIVLN